MTEKHSAINGYHYGQVRERIGNAVVTVKDFKSVGPVRATDYGVASTQSDDFACMLHGVMDKTEKDNIPPDEQGPFYLLFTTLSACKDDNGRVTGNDKHFAKFIEINATPLSRDATPRTDVEEPRSTQEFVYGVRAR